MDSWIRFVLEWTLSTQECDAVLWVGGREPKQVGECALVQGLCATQTAATVWHQPGNQPTIILSKQSAVWLSNGLTTVSIQLCSYLTIKPSNYLIIQPSSYPTILQTNNPTIKLSNNQNTQPCNHGTIQLVNYQPSNDPTIQPSNHLTILPSYHPTIQPTKYSTI